MSRVIAVLLAVALAAAPASVRAAGVVGALSEAQASFYAGDYYKTAELAAPLLDDESLPRADRASALRLYGLALYFLGKREEADHYLFEYLKLEPTAHLDPALVPPDGIAFFENVRSNHATELPRYMARPKWTDSALISVVPLAGQLQNGETAKGWVLVSTEVLLAATFATSYFVFRDLCDQPGSSCRDEEGARTARTINVVSGALLGGVFVYGVIDGVYHYRERKSAFDEANQGIGVGVEVGEDRAQLTFSGRF